MDDATVLSTQEKKSGVGDSALSGNREASTAEEESEEKESVQDKAARLCGLVGVTLKEGLNHAKQVLCKPDSDRSADTHSRKTSTTDKVSEGREPSVSFDSYESFGDLDAKPSMAESLKASVGACFVTVRSALARLGGKKDEEEIEMEKMKTKLEAGSPSKANLRAEVASWEYSKFYTLIRLTSSVQPGSHHPLHATGNQARWRRCYLVTIMVLIIIIFLTPVINSIDPNWANAEKMCVRRKAKIDEVNALLTQKTRLQEAAEQMELSRMVKAKTDEILERGYIMSKPEKEARLFGHAVSPHIFFGGADKTTLDAYVAAARGGTLTSEDNVLFKMYQNFPHTCSVETIASLTAASFTKNCELPLGWEMVEDQLMEGLRSCHDFSEHCRDMLEDSVGGNVLGNGVLCDGLKAALSATFTGFDQYEDAMNCDPLRYDVFYDLMTQFFNNKRNQFLEKLPTFCNPRDSLIAQQAQQAYESFLKHSQRAADNFQVPVDPDDTRGFIDEVRRQFHIVVVVWASFKVARVVFALPASPYSEPWMSVYRTPIVHLSPLTVAFMSLILLNIYTILTSEGLFAGLTAAFTYFNDDPCNVMETFTRERVFLINQTCNELLKMSRQHIEARFEYGVRYQSMNLYKGCFNDFWGGLGIQGDCPLCNYLHSDFVLCDDCTGNVSWYNNQTNPQQLRDPGMSFGKANAFMLEGFEGFCAPNVLQTLYLEANDEELYQHSGVQLLFYSGFLLELIFPILLLHCCYEMFAVKNPTTLHKSIEATSRLYIIHDHDNPQVNKVIRWQHEPCLCVTTLSIIIWFFFYAAIGAVEIESPELFVQPYSYLPAPIVNHTGMTQPGFLEDRMKNQPVSKNGIENRWMCWGDTPESLPLTSFLSNFSASKSAICGITDEHRVVCWGKITTAYHYAPNSASKEVVPFVKAADIPPEEIYEQLALGETFACAMDKQKRKFKCWGKNIPGKFRLSRGLQDKCGSLWYHERDQIDKNTFGVNDNTGSFEVDFHESTFDEIAAGSYHLCGYASSTTSLKCVGYFKGGTRTCRWTEQRRRRRCRKWAWWTVRCWWVYWDVHFDESVREHKYFRLHRTDVLHYAVTFSRVCMVDADFILDCFDLSRATDNQLVSGSSKSSKQYDLGTIFDTNDPTSLKVMASNEVLCVFQHHLTACETSPNSMTFTSKNTTIPTTSFIYALNRNVLPLRAGGVHSNLLPPSQTKAMFLQADGVLEDAPPRVPPIKEVVTNGQYSCATFKTPL